MGRRRQGEGTVERRSIPIGKGLALEAAASIPPQPLQSIRGSRPARMLALPLEADGRLEAGVDAGKPLRCGARPWQEGKISGGLLPHKIGYGNSATLSQELLH